MKIQIWSGEGDGPGTCETYTAEESHNMTWRKLSARLARERCGGDRWARATWETGEPIDTDGGDVAAVIRFARDN